MSSGWLTAASKFTNKPKNSLIEALKTNIAGFEKGRPRDVLHASDVTKTDFCPRKEAFLDLDGEKLGAGSYIPAALRVTFDMGKETELMIVEEWGTGVIIGDWKCRICNLSRSMCLKPGIYDGINGSLKENHAHDWEYLQWPAVSNEYGISGSVDSLWSVGTPLWLMAELKTMAPTEFEGIIAPLPEHRLRTNLYMKIIGDSDSPYKGKVNLHEARVLYTSRAYGKKNDLHGGEILPWKEFTVERNDNDLLPILDRAKQLKVFRDSPEHEAMPAGICGTAIDKIAKKCDKCVQCFSGKNPATQPPLVG